MTFEAIVYSPVRFKGLSGPPQLVVALVYYRSRYYYRFFFNSYHVMYETFLYIKVKGYTSLKFS